jgi:HEAT repeat protein
MRKRKSLIIYSVIFLFLMLEAVEGLSSPTPKESLSEILQKLKTYEQGQNDSIVLKLNAFIRSHRTPKEAKLACEHQLISFLKGTATATAKMEVCRQLRIIGSRESIPVLEDMLLKNETTDMARYALEKIPDIDSEKALLRALNHTNGVLKAGIISSLGHRKVPEAVPFLKEILSDHSDSSLSLAAAAALGHIANPEAAAALSKALSKTSAMLKIQVAGSLLKCAETYLSNEENEKALNIYNQILSSDLPLSLHNSAFRGKIIAAGPMGKALIIKALQHNKKLIIPSIEMIPEYFDDSDISQISSLIPTLSDSLKVPLISVLSLYPQKEILQTVIESTQSSNQEVRLVSLRTLKKIGTSSSVKFLAEYAAYSKGVEQKESRISLRGLKGADINSTIVSNMENEKNPEIQIEYIKAIEERRIFSGKDFVFIQLNSPYEKARLQAIKSIKNLSTPKDIPRLIKFLIKTENHQDREEMINTIAFTAYKEPNPLQRGGAVTKALPEVQEPIIRSSLYLLLGRIGDDSTLGVLRRGMNESNEIVQEAVVRAFASWPTPTAADDVFYIAKTSDNPKHRTLCLKSYIRMIEMEPFRRSEAAVRSLETALGLAQTISEKLMILGVLPKFPCDQAAELAEHLTKDKDVEQEARNALNLIKETLKKEKNKI